MYTSYKIMDMMLIFVENQQVCRHTFIVYSLVGENQILWH
jgi:hypothetical protein